MTRSKLLEQVKVITDATTAFAKGTAHSVVVQAAGSGTLQTCDTADGTYTDFATLAEGANNIDISGANAYLQVATTTGAAVLGDFDADPQA